MDDKPVVRDIVLLNVSGNDRPGLLASLCEALQAHAAQVLDVGQAVIHDGLVLGLLVTVPAVARADMLNAAHAVADTAGSTLSHTIVDHDRHEQWINAAGKPQFILTLLASDGGMAALNAVSRATRSHNVNIDTVRRLSGRITPEQAGAATCALEMRVRGEAVDQDALKSDLMREADALGFDVGFQADTVFRRNRRLVAFDMDSTLIQAEVIDELARHHGVFDRVQAITARAMAGELDFQGSFRARAKLLAGLSEAALDAVAGSVQLTQGANRLVRSLRQLGYKTAIISGGFQYVGERLKESLGVDFVYANQLEVVNGVMTGNVLGEIVDAERKAQLLRDICAREGISLEQAIAIGDGANDLPMLNTAGLGIAFHAKPLVKETARHAISNFGLDSVLYLMGFSDQDIAEMLR